VAGAGHGAATVSLWTVETVEFRGRELDFTSSGGSKRATTALFADGTEIINALNFIDTKDDPIAFMVCEQCGTPGCSGGNRVQVRGFGDGILIVPAFDAMAAGDWEQTEYGPPYFLTKRGPALFRGRALATLERRLPSLADPDRWPPLTAREAVLLLQWEAPARVLGTFPEKPRLRTELIAETATGTVSDAEAALSAAIDRFLADPRPVRTVPGEPLTFYLDQAGFPEWCPLTYDGTTYRLALADGIGWEPS
jgi:hypothetical protein